MTLLSYRHLILVSILGHTYFISQTYALPVFSFLPHLISWCFFLHFLYLALMALWVGCLPCCACIVLVTLISHKLNIEIGTTVGVWMSIAWQNQMNHNSHGVIHFIRFVQRNRFRKLSRNAWRYNVVWSL